MKMMLIMPSRGSCWLNQNFRHVLQIRSPTARNSRFESNNERFQRNSLIMSGSRLGRSGYNWMHPGVNFFGGSTSRSTGSYSNGVKRDVKVQPPVTSSARARFCGWLRWVFCSALSFLLAFSDTWQKLRRIEGTTLPLFWRQFKDIREAEMVVEGTAKVANVVEKVATEVEKVAEDVSENVSDESNLKNTALLVENISKQGAHEAHLTQDFLHKVDAVKNHPDALESIVEPIIDKISNI